jgi:3-phenylpropionate/cinnamic acid dioxygenase small subunit
MKNQHAVEQFLYQQSELLDSKRWQDWIDLFTPDGIYWMPPAPEYKTWDGQPAICRCGKPTTWSPMSAFRRSRRTETWR